MCLQSPARYTMLCAPSPGAPLSPDSLPPQNMLTACATDSPPCAPRLSHRHKAWPRTPGRSPGSRCGWKSSWARAASERCGWVSLTPPAHQPTGLSRPLHLPASPSHLHGLHSIPPWASLFGPQFLFSPELLGCICDSLTTRCVICIKATHGVPNGAVGLRRPSSRWGVMEVHGLACAGFTGLS